MPPLPQRITYRVAIDREAGAFAAVVQAVEDRGAEVVETQTT